SILRAASPSRIAASRSHEENSMNAPLRALAPDAHRRLLVADMGRALVEGNVDLGDERAGDDLPAPDIPRRRRHRAAGRCDLSRARHDGGARTAGWIALVPQITYRPAVCSPRGS